MIPFTRHFRLPLFLLAFLPILAQEQKPWPRRVLITNDNGIEDIKLIELARGFAQVAETHVVAPKQDRSGSGNYLPGVQSGTLAVERRDLGTGIQAYAVDGFPADCVVLALAGIMAENPPDLVISGINGGANLGIAWIFSGTIGAARVASLAGVPTIAVSGLDDDLPGSLAAGVAFVIRLAQSPLMRDWKPGRYLTVSMPRLPPDRIKGVRFATRAGLDEALIFSPATETPNEDGRTLWKATGIRKLPYQPGPETDAVLYQNGYIAIIPMHSDEQDHAWLNSLRQKEGYLPTWQP